MHFSSINVPLPYPRLSPPSILAVWSSCWVIRRGHKSPNSRRLSAPINQLCKIQIISGKMNISWWHCFTTALILRQFSQSGLIPLLFCPGSRGMDSWIEWLLPKDGGLTSQSYLIFTETPLAVDKPTQRHMIWKVFTFVQRKYLFTMLKLHLLIQINRFYIILYFN